MRTNCTEECRARVECAACYRIKKPIGRSAPLETANGMCDRDCAGYNPHDLKVHLWPSEALIPDENGAHEMPDGAIEP